MEQEVRQQWIQGERLMAKRKPRVGSKAWWDKELEKPSPQLENKAFSYKGPSYRKTEYGKTEYYQKGDDGKFRHSEDYIPVRGAKEEREDVTYIPIAKRFDMKTGESRPQPVRATPQVEVEEEEVATPKQTRTSNEPESYLQVRELWPGKSSPYDLEVWATSKKATKEGVFWKRKKDNVTVIYNEKDRSFSIDMDAADSSSDGNNRFGPEP